MAKHQLGEFTMRKTVITLLALGLAASFAATTAAAAPLPLSETFSYPDGNLVPNGGWANFSGAVTDVQVVSGRAVGFGPNANDDHVFFTAQPLTAKTYACFLVKIPAVVGPPKPIYFFAMKDAGTANFVSRVYVLQITGGWTFGLSHSSTSATVGVVPWSASTLLYDHDYNVVVCYDPVAHSSTMWVDPVNELSTSVSIVNAAIAALPVSTVILRQSATAATLPPTPVYTGTADWGFSVDNLGVGTTFNEACVAGPTPTRVQTWGRLKALYR
jgi:hypothetical protein